MSKKSEVERMKKALKAYIDSEEKSMSAEDRKKQAWFPITVLSTIEMEESKLIEHAHKTAEGLVGIGFTEEEINQFKSKLHLFCDNLKK